MSTTSGKTRALRPISFDSGNVSIGDISTQGLGSSVVAIGSGAQTPDLIEGNTAIGEVAIILGGIDPINERFNLALGYDARVDYSGGCASIGPSSRVNIGSRFSFAAVTSAVGSTAGGNGGYNIAIGGSTIQDRVNNGVALSRGRVLSGNGQSLAVGNSYILPNTSTDTTNNIALAGSRINSECENVVAISSVQIGASSSHIVALDSSAVGSSCSSIMASTNSSVGSSNVEATVLNNGRIADSNSNVIALNSGVMGSNNSTSISIMSDTFGDNNQLVTCLISQVGSNLVDVFASRSFVADGCTGIAAFDRAIVGLSCSNILASNSSSLGSSNNEATVLNSGHIGDSNNNVIVANSGIMGSGNSTSISIMSDTFGDNNQLVTCLISRVGSNLAEVFASRSFISDGCNNIAAFDQSTVNARCSSVFASSSTVEVGSSDVIAMGGSSVGSGNVSVVVLQGTTGESVSLAVAIGRGSHVTASYGLAFGINSLAGANEMIIGNPATTGADAVHHLAVNGYNGGALAYLDVIDSPAMGDTGMNLIFNNAGVISTPTIHAAVTPPPGAFLLYMTP